MRADAQGLFFRIIPPPRPGHRTAEATDKHIVRPTSLRRTGYRSATLSERRLGSDEVEVALTACGDMTLDWFGVAQQLVEAPHDRPVLSTWAAHRSPKHGMTVSA